MTERLHFHFSLSCTGEGNGNPLQCSRSLGGHTESDTTEATEQQQQQLLGFPGGASGKEPACQSRRHETQVQSCVKKIPQRRHGNPFQCSCLENPMDRGA